MRLPGHIMVGSAIAVSFLDYENIFHIPALIMGGSFIIGNIWPDVWDRVMSLGSHALWEKIHRTFSHWIWLYFIGLAVLIFLPQFFVVEVAIFFLAGCVTHCLVDLFSPSGVPFISPFGERVSFNLIRNRSFLEIILPIMLLSLVILIKFPLIRSATQILVDRF